MLGKQMASKLLLILIDDTSEDNYSAFDAGLSFLLYEKDIMHIFNSIFIRVIFKCIRMRRINGKN